MNNALRFINAHTPYQASLGRQPHLLPLLEGGHHGDHDVTGQNNIARVGEIAGVAIHEAIARQMFARGDN